MKKKDAISLNVALNNFITRNNMTDKILEIKLKNAWHEVVGAEISKLTESVNYNDFKIYVKINSAVVKQELLFRKSDIINKINQNIGSIAISDFKFY